MTTAVDICNLALAACEQRPIESLTEDTVAAEHCRAVFHPLVRQVLRRYPFACATARASLPALAEAPAFEFLRQFQLPSDCLAVRDLPDLPQHWRWVVEGRRLLCDLDAPVKVIYTTDLALDPVTGADIAGGSPMGVDPLLAQAIAMRLATHLSPKFSGSASKTAELEKRYREALVEARSIDATESVPRVLRESSWVETE